MAGKEVGAPAIGIDLGTTYSCVAVCRDDRVEIITNDLGNRTTPSCVAFTDDQRLIGDAAKNQITRNYANTVFDTKRLIGRRFSEVMVQDAIKCWPFKVIEGPHDKPRIVVTHMGHEKQFSAEEISSMVLSKLKDVAEAYLGEPVINSVITVPAYFNDRQRQATKAAAEIAGLNVMRMISEPTAAAIAYGVDNRSYLNGKKNVLVFDLGGGTFDVSLLTMDDEGTFDVKAVSGDTHLGGEDFDNNLMNYCVNKYAKQNLNEDLTGNKKAMGRLRAACESAKRDLSCSSQTSIDLDALHNGQDFSMIITKAKFEKLNMDVFSNCIKKLETCLVDAKMQKGSVDVIILVGGSTRIPKIQDMLQEFFDGKTLCKGINPDEAVAHGAAILAAKLSGQATKMLKKLLLMDVTPLSLGTEIYGEVMSVLIPRNTPIPTKKTRTFVTTRDKQTYMDTKVYQGERTKTSENYLLGQLKISGIPPAPKGEAEVKDSFEIDVNGILTVTSKIVGTGKTEKLTVTNHCGKLSEEEMKKMVKNAKKFKAEDQRYKRKVIALNDLMDCLYALKKKMKGNDLSPKAWEHMKYVYDETKKWLSSNKAATGDEIQVKKENVESLSKAFSN